MAIRIRLENFSKRSAFTLLHVTNNGEKIIQTRFVDVKTVEGFDFYNDVKFMLFRPLLRELWSRVILTCVITIARVVHREITCVHNKKRNLKEKKQLNNTKADRTVSLRFTNRYYNDHLIMPRPYSPCRNEYNLNSTRICSVTRV